jgi:HAE1 family hydrophobic/amphiphilic exporter-1
MMFIIVAGLLTVTNMRREMFPQFALDMINVSVPYPGASPAEVEEGICIKSRRRSRASRTSPGPILHPVKAWAR